MKRDPTCPVCQADMMLAGDEKAGEEVFCSYCGAPCIVAGKNANDELEVEEDF